MRLKDRWKNLKPWGKGGFIGLFIYSLISIITLLWYLVEIIRNNSSDQIGLIWLIPGIPLIIFTIPTNLHENLFTEFLMSSYSIYFISLAIIYFLIGALVGLFIGKVKSK